MKQILEQMIGQAIVVLKQNTTISEDLQPVLKIERTKDSAHGDYATNLALMLAKPCGQTPRKMAEMLIEAMPKNPAVNKIEIAGAGFINFFINADAVSEVVRQVLTQGDSFGSSSLGQGQKVLIEFVSSNPTGPLHVGHGRGAAFGATLSNLLSTAGFCVSREYYVNDAGRQMNILAASVWLRYLELTGEKFVFPANGYRGDYVYAIAQCLQKQYGNQYAVPWAQVSKNLPLDEPEGGDKEIYIDALIQQARALLGEEGFKLFHKQALDYVLSDIKEDLVAFGVEFDCWFSEQTLLDDGSIQKAIHTLKDAGHTYLQDGALWFKATEFGDEKDRVLIRANGQNTYFAADAAYHWNKYNRGYDKVIDIFGSDHHGYLTRVKAAVNALGHDDSALKVLLVQFAILYRGGERVQMSTRSGSFVTLRDLREEIGKDAARFFYVARKPEQHMDFDLDLAKAQSNDNPVYYVQYAHARICSVLRQLRERGLSWNEAKGLDNIALLSEPQEIQLISLVSQYPEVIESAALNYEPHQLTYYLRELANGLHSYYNAVTLLCEQEDLRCARLCLLKTVRQVISNGLNILGVSAPESM